MKKTITCRVLLAFALTVMLFSAPFARADTVHEQDIEEVDGTMQTENADRTEAVLEELRADGVIQRSTTTVGEVKIHLGLMPAAARIIERNRFDVRGNGFSLELLEKAILDHFTDSLSFLRAWLPDTKVKEIYVLIDDFGDKRKSSSGSAAVNSRVIKLDIRRWHKNFVRQKHSSMSLTIAHELTHVLTYERDSRETKYHREVTGVLFEQINYLRLYGVDRFANSYLGETTTRIVDAEAEGERVLSTTYVDNQPLRLLLFNFLRKVSRNEYRVPAEFQNEKAQTLKKLAVAYIKSSKNGDAGFDEACTSSGLTVNGAPLTIQRIRQDAYDALTKPQ